MSALELQSLIQRCTAQAVEATHPVSRVEVGTSRQMLVYAQLVGGRRTLSAVGRPLGLSTRPLRVGHHGFTCRGWPESRTQAGHARARFDTLAGETVIVEALTTEVYGFKAGIISVPWERVWRKRGKTLVELGRYALGGSADGEKPTDPTPCVRQGTLSR